MLSITRTQKAHGEDGFTLIELLVVILIIGILAAIALPAFLGQKAKGQDSSAKSDARNAVSLLESCFTAAQTYSGCDLSKGGLTVGTGDGQVQLIAADTGTDKFKVTAYSKSKNTFTITKASASGTAQRTCSTSAGTADGGCNGSSW